MFVASWLVASLTLVGAVVVGGVFGTAFAGFGAGTVTGLELGVIAGLGVYVAVAMAMVRSALEPDRRRGVYIAHALVVVTAVAVVVAVIERA